MLGITRVDPIRHELLFERFINEGRTAYPDVDIDFSSERREEVIQYVYAHYGAEHAGMVCNLVTYRARSAVREVGYALGFPRPLVDRVAKALETYDSVMVRRDLEAEGGFGQFFARPGEGVDGALRVERRVAEETAVTGAATLARERGLTDAMGQLNHARGGRFGADLAAEHGRRPAGAPRGRGGGGAGWSSTEGRARPSGRSAGSAGSAGTSPMLARRQVGERAPGEEPGMRRAHDAGGGDHAGRADARIARSTQDRAAQDRRGRTGRTRTTHPERRWRPGDDEGGPGDSPVSVASPGRRTEPGCPAPPHARTGRCGAIAAPRRARARPADRPRDRRLLPAERRWDPRTGDPDLPIGGVSALDRPIDERTDAADDKGGPGDETAGRRRWAREDAARRSRAREAVAATKDRSNSVAKLPPVAELRPDDIGRHEGSVAGLSDWERWLELCARIDGFPRHLSIHSAGCS